MSTIEENNPAELFILSLKDKLGASSDVDLAIRIGVAKSTIATWRRRREVPLKFALSLHERFGVNYLYFVNHTRSADESSDDFQNMAFYFALMRLGQSLNTVEEIKQASAGIQLLSQQVRALFFFPREAGITDSEYHSIAMRSLMDVYEGKKGSVEELRKMLSMVF